ncbi:MAG: TIGR02186 family protein [Paracoccus sp. (in: a-proteobacteria)]
MRRALFCMLVWALWVECPALAQEAPIMSFPSPEKPRDGSVSRFPAEQMGPPAPAEQVVAGISSDEVAITTSFDGSEIILYGAVRRETPIPTDSQLQVVATVEGPPRSVTIRRKQRRMGIWINTESVVVGATPSFYSVATTAPLDMILEPDQDSRHRISIPTAMRSFARSVNVKDPVEFTEAMIASRIADGSYQLNDGSLQLVDDTLFRADFSLPANLVEGVYKIRIFLIRNGRVVDAYSAPLDVNKVGLERWLYRLAFDQPLIYGLMSLLIAAFAGWAASAAFRGLQRN